MKSRIEEATAKAAQLSQGTGNEFKIFEGKTKEGSDVLVLKLRDSKGGLIVSHSKWTNDQFLRVLNLLDVSTIGYVQKLGVFSSNLWSTANTVNYKGRISISIIKPTKIAEFIEAIQVMVKSITGLLHFKSAA